VQIQVSQKVFFPQLQDSFDEILDMVEATIEVEEQQQARFCWWEWQ